MMKTNKQIQEISQPKEKFKKLKDLWVKISSKELSKYRKMAEDDKERWERDIQKNNFLK